MPRAQQRNVRKMWPPPSPLSPEEKRALLELARRAIRQFIQHEEMVEVPLVTGGLAQKCGVFVSLHHDSCLRGCIGQLQDVPGLAEGVIRCAISAARDDQRFSPVTAGEIDALEIEISVLSAPRQIAAEQVIPGEHGLLIVRGPFRGLLLPQVARQLGLDRERFLEETCRKAGLARDAWRDAETQILAFTADVFSEAAPGERAT